MTRATKISKQGGKVVIETPHGTITAERALVATDAYTEGLEPVTEAHVMPIGSFIGATPPLDNFPPILPGKESVETAVSSYAISARPKTIACCSAVARPTRRKSHAISPNTSAGRWPKSIRR